MRTLIYLVVLGGVYGIAHDGAGLSNGWSAGLAWLAAAIVFLAFRARGYRAAVRVERWRAVAAALREGRPDVYANILGLAGGTPESDAAAQRDPDAFVALWLAEADREGVSAFEISEWMDDVRAFAAEHDL